VLFGLCQIPLGGRSVALAQGTPYTSSSPLRACCLGAASEQEIAIRDTLPSLLSVSRNAASIPRSLSQSWRRVLGQARATEGGWRRPQDAARINALALTAEGEQRAGAWFVSGGVTYGRASDVGVSWRNTSDAYLGNSFIWADSVGGTFQRDELALAGALVTPSWRGVNAGVQIDYGLGQGARQNDPKPLFRRRVAELSPAVAYTFGRQQIGAGVMLGWQGEDLEIGGGLSAEFPLVYRLRGLGTFDRTQLISAERAMIGGVSGAHAGWSRTGDRWVTAIGTTLRVERDSVRDGIATPVSGGATRRTRRDGEAALRRRSARGGLEVAAALRMEEARGVDPIFRAVNVIDEGTAMEARLRWWRGVDPVAARWGAGLVVSQSRLSRRDIAAETSWEAVMPSLAATATRRVPAPGGDLLLGVGGGLGWRGSTAYSAQRPTQLTPILALADFGVVSAPTRRALLSLAWERIVAGRVSSRVRVDGSLARTSGRLADDRESLARSMWSLSLELF